MSADVSERINGGIIDGVVMASDPQNHQSIQKLLFTNAGVKLKLWGIISPREKSGPFWGSKCNFNFQISKSKSKL